MVVGAVSVPIFKFAIPLVPGWGAIVSQAEELAPSFILALIAGGLATLLTRRGDDRAPRLDALDQLRHP